MNHLPIRIYGIFPYDRGAKARWLLTELGVEFESRWLDREKSEFDSPEYLRINPMGRVPAMQMGDLSLFESGALCAYLADLHLDRGMAPALSAPERAKYQQWMYFASSTLDVFQTRIMIIEDIPAGEIHQKKMTALVSELTDACGVLNQALSKDSFLVANRFSAADICVGYHLYWCKLWPEFEEIMKRHPHLLSYMERLEKMPSAIQAKVFSYSG
jgi:glutathione S-transferase